MVGIAIGMRPAFTRPQRDGDRDTVQAHSIDGNPRGFARGKPAFRRLNKVKVYKTRNLPKSCRGKSADMRGIAGSDFVSESRLAIRGVSLSQKGLFEAE